jgi:hypothetical protein
MSSTHLSLYLAYNVISSVISVFSKSNNSSVHDIYHHENAYSSDCGVGFSGLVHVRQ